MMMLALGGLSLFCHITRQSNIVAALVIGLIFGGLGWDEKMGLSMEIDHSFIELGNVLILFFAGLSTEYSSFEIYWKQICLISMGQFIAYIGTFAGIGIAIGLCTNEISTVYFGLACAMSSTIMVKDHLTRAGEEKHLHGKILKGVMVLQDSTAACSFVIIEAFARIRKAMPDAAPSHAMADLYAMDRAGSEILRAGGLFLALLLALALLKLFVLERAFKLYRKEADLLFIGAMAFNLGASALCQLVGFSPMAGAYFAGMALSFLPTRSHIESKISSLKTFGMTNFYFMLGVSLHLDAAALRRLGPSSALVAGLVAFVMPAVWVASTRAVRLRGRTRAYIGCVSNSMGEFSLIIQVRADLTVIMMMMNDMILHSIK
jgi:Kef-type K+ transport system membrane component KefB